MRQFIVMEDATGKFVMGELINGQWLPMWDRRFKALPEAKTKTKLYAAKVKGVYVEPEGVPPIKTY